MKYGMTGTRKGMTDAQAQAFVFALKKHPKLDHLVHGDCIGADNDAHDIALNMGHTITIRPCDLEDQIQSAVSLVQKVLALLYMHPLHVVFEAAPVAMQTDVSAAGIADTFGRTDLYSHSLLFPNHPEHHAYKESFDSDTDNLSGSLDLTPTADRESFRN